MGDVYLAEDLDLGRHVAIKFLNAPFDDHARQRLLNEARAVAALDHPLICAVHEVGHDEAHGDFIVMQYVDGETLATRLTRGPLAPDATLELAADVADALDAAHRRGIVHRDLKPQNIVLQPSGRPKLLDFGISKRLTPPDGVTQAPTGTPLTGAHTLVGTPGYMSPEQMRGKPADFRSDLFALGCVLYECLTARRAFAGTTTAEVFGQVLHVDPPAVSTTAVGVSPDLDVMVSRLLRKAPHERFQSAAEVLGAIRTLRGLTTRVDSRASARTRTGGWRPTARQQVVGVSALVVAAIAGWWVWSRNGSLVEPPPGAARWYGQGVEALRDGAYAGARASLEEAIRLFPDDALAYSRLAEACAELDDDAAAQVALLRVAGLNARLPGDERLRLDAVRSLVLRDYDQAIKAFTTLLARHPTDAGLHVDAGRAVEAAGNAGQAREYYAKAVALDPQYAAAHLRLGSAAARAGETKLALSAFDEAIRLYRASTRIEGEAEALIRKAARQSATGDYAGARTSSERAIAISVDERYLPQRLRASFQLARVTMAEGRFAEAEALATAAVAQAQAAGHEGMAAEGLIAVANSLLALGRSADADAEVARAIALAAKKGARRIEMQARLQQAYFRHAAGNYREAVALAQGPLKFFEDGRYRDLTAQAKNVLSRAREYLEEYDEARRLTTEVLEYAEAVNNNALVAETLENLAGQLTKLGNLPEAERRRRRIEQISRAQGDHQRLKYDLTNRAELLIGLGRGIEAMALLDEIRKAIATGHPAYADRPRRVAALGALLASTERRYADVESLANEAIKDPTDKPDSASLLALVLREHARAQLGRSREALSAISARLTQTTSPSFRRELAYWVSRTLLARKDAAAALSVVTTELAAPPLATNVELRWRLRALADLAVAAGATASPGMSFASSVDEDVRHVTAEWAAGASLYFARPDLADLRKTR
jgi:tetratricopeptide (TPR) repeat protein/predicted Ser/Thr protein kinase